LKEAIFPFRQFPEVDPALGPEIRSTGQVIGVADAFGRAYYKALEAAGQRLPNQGTVLISISRRERPAVLEVVRQFMNLEFKVKTTRGTNRFLMKHGIASEMVHKLHEGRPNIVDDIKNDVYGLIINTPSVVQQYYLYNMYGLCHYSLHVETSRSLEHDGRAAQNLGSMGASKDNAPKSCLAFPYLLVCR